MLRALADTPAAPLDMEQLDSVGRQLVTNALHLWHRELGQNLRGSQSQLEDAVLLAVSLSTGGLFRSLSYFSSLLFYAIVRVGSSFGVSLSGLLASPICASTSGSSSVPSS